MKNLLYVILAIFLVSCSSEELESTSRIIFFNLVAEEDGLSVSINNSLELSDIEFKGHSLYHEVKGGKSQVIVKDNLGTTLTSQEIELVDSRYHSAYISKNPNGDYIVKVVNDFSFFEIDNQNLPGIQRSFMRLFISSSTLPFETIDAYHGSATHDAVPPSDFYWYRFHNDARPQEDVILPIIIDGSQPYFLRNDNEQFIRLHSVFVLWNGEAPDIEGPFDQLNYTVGDIVPTSSPNELVLPSLSRKPLDWLSKARQTYVLIVYDDPNAENGYDGMLVELRDIIIKSPL